MRAINFEKPNFSKLNAILGAFWVTFARQVFYGRRHYNRAEYSYEATLWYTLWYFPVYPVDTYKVREQGKPKFFPELFHLDEYVPYDLDRINFDWFHALIVFALSWTPVVALAVACFAYPFVGILLLAFVGIGVSFNAMRTTAPPIRVYEPGQSISDLRNKLEVMRQQQQQPVQTIEVEQPPAPEPIVAPKPKAASKTSVKKSVIVPEVKVIQPPPTDNIPVGKGLGGEQVVPHLWDDLFVIRDEHRSLPLTKPVPIKQGGGFILFLGCLDFFYILVYSALRTLFSTNPPSNNFVDVLNTIFRHMGNEIVLGVATLIIGVMVFTKSKLFGFILIITAVAMYMAIHPNLNFVIAWRSML